MENKPKRKKPVMASSRAMTECRKLGWLCGKVEMWIPSAEAPGGGFRRDLFGWMDVLAVNPEYTIGIQACMMSDRAAHLDKLCDPDLLDKLQVWLQLKSNHAELWAFRKRKVKRGGVAVRWSYEVTNLGEVLLGIKAKTEDSVV